jgi:hypothetical protein
MKNQQNWALAQQNQQNQWVAQPQTEHPGPGQRDQKPTKSTKPTKFNEKPTKLGAGPIKIYKIRLWFGPKGRSLGALPPTDFVGFVGPGPNFVGFSLSFVVFLGFVGFWPLEPKLVGFPLIFIGFVGFVGFWPL